MADNKNETFSEKQTNRINDTKKENINIIDSLISRYNDSNSDSDYYKRYAKVLEKVKKLEPEDKDVFTINEILTEMEKQNSINEIRDYMLKLNNILKEYDKEKKWTHTKTQQDLAKEQKKMSSQKSSSSNNTLLEDWENNWKLPSFNVKPEDSGLGTAPGAPESKPENETTTLVQPEQELSDEFKELKKIHFDWKITSSEQLDEKIQELSEEIMEGNIYKNLTEEEKLALVYELQQYAERYEKAQLWKEMALSGLEWYFEDLAKNIVEKNWKAYIKIRRVNENWQIEEVTIEFPSKQDAINHIAEMKKNAESVLQSFTQNILEGTWNAIWNSIKWTYSTVYGDLFLWSLSYFGRSLKDLFTGDFEASELWHAFLSSILLAFSSSVALYWGFVTSVVLLWTPTALAESLSRRVYKDFILSSDKSSSRVYQDYYNRESQLASALANSSSPEFEDVNEFRERQSIIEKLKTLRDAEVPWSKLFIEYNNTIKKLEKYKLNKTPTFYYLLAVKVLSDDKLEGSLSFLKTLLYRWGKAPLYPKSTWRPWKGDFYKRNNWAVFNPVDTQDIRRKIISKLDNKISNPNNGNSVKEKLEKIYWKSIEIKQKSDGFSYEVKFTWSNDPIPLKDLLNEKYYLWIIDHIEKTLPSSTPEEIAIKNQRIENVRKYFGKTLMYPKWESVLYFDLYKLEQWYMTNDDSIRLIDNKIQNITWLRKYTSKVWIFWRVWTEIHKLNYLKKLVEDNKILLKESDIDDIAKWRKSISDLKKVKDLNINNIISTINNHITTEWEKISKEMENLKKNYWLEFGVKPDNAWDDWVEYKNIDKFKETEFWKWLTWQIDYILEETPEREAKEDLLKIFNDIENWRIFFDSESNFLKYINDNVRHIDKYTQTPFEIDDFKKLFNGYKWYAINDFVKNLFPNDHSNKSDIEISKEITEKYKEEINLAKIYEELLKIQSTNNTNSNHKNINHELWEFIGTLKNNSYTNGQAIYVLEEILKGNWFQKNYTQVVIDHARNTLDIKEELKNKIKNELKANPAIVDKLKQFAQSLGFDTSSKGIFEEIFEPNKKYIEEINKFNDELKDLKNNSDRTPLDDLKSRVNDFKQKPELVGNTEIENLADNLINRIDDYINRIIENEMKLKVKSFQDHWYNSYSRQNDIQALEQFRWDIESYRTSNSNILDATLEKDIQDLLDNIDGRINHLNSNSSPNSAPNRGPWAGLDKKGIRKYREEIIPYLRQIEAQLIINLYDSKDAREVSLALDKYETYTNNQISLISKNNIEELHSILENITDINLRRRTILNFLTEKMYPWSNFNVLNKTKLETKINWIKNSGIRIKIHWIEGGGKFKIKDIFEHTKTKFKF